MDFTMTKQVDLTQWERQFSDLLAAEDLVDRKQFLTPLDEFDEVPLYTRISRISFLDGLSAKHRNVVLLALALKYADSVHEVAARELGPRALAEFFLMVTLMNWDDYREGGAIKPCLWTTTRASDELSRMELTAPYSEEARIVESWLTEIGDTGQYCVADYRTPCDDRALMRVHVGRRHLPRMEMRTVAQLVR